MGGGNAQKSAVARERNQKAAAARSGGKYVFLGFFLVSSFM
jgi:hypothetical protein